MVPTIDAHPKAPSLLGPYVICEPHPGFPPPLQTLGGQRDPAQLQARCPLPRALVTTNS